MEWADVGAQASPSEEACAVWRAEAWHAQLRSMRSRALESRPLDVRALGWPCGPDIVSSCAILKCCRHTNTVHRLFVPLCSNGGAQPVHERQTTFYWQARPTTLPHFDRGNAAPADLVCTIRSDVGSETI